MDNLFVSTATPYVNATQNLGDSWILWFVVTLLSSALVATVVAERSENKRYLKEKRIHRYDTFLQRVHKLHRQQQERWGQNKDKPIKVHESWELSEGLDDLELVASRRVLTLCRELSKKLSNYHHTILENDEAMQLWNNQDRFEEFIEANRKLNVVDIDFRQHIAKIVRAMRRDVLGYSELLSLKESQEEKDMTLQLND